MKVSVFSITTIAVLFALYLALTSYTNSSFLTDIVMSDKLVNIIYTLGGIFSLVHLYILSHTKYTKLAFTTSFTLLALSLIVLLTKLPQFILIPASIIYLGLGTGLLYIMDLLINEETPANETGSIRGRYLAFQSLVWVIGPLIVGFITDHLGGRTNLYILAFLLLVALIILTGSLKKMPIMALPKHVPQPSHHILHKRVSAFVNTFILNSFYALMIIGMPVYLTKSAGWNWSHIGLTFTLMLTTFPLVQFPLGKYLDTHKKEFRNLSSLSLIIMALSAVGIIIVAPVSYIFATILFITSRIGAATLEVTSDTAFFSTVSDQHKNLIAWYRALVPISYTIIPFCSIFIKFYQTRIFILAAIMGCVAIYYVRSNTKNIKHTLNLVS